MRRIRRRREGGCRLRPKEKEVSMYGLHLLREGFGSIFHTSILETLAMIKTALTITECIKLDMNKKHPL